MVVFLSNGMLNNLERWKKRGVFHVESCAKRKVGSTCWELVVGNRKKCGNGGEKLRSEDMNFSCCKTKNVEKMNYASPFA